jgi:uncharacterized membrane protein
VNYELLRKAHLEKVMHPALRILTLAGLIAIIDIPWLLSAQPYTSAMIRSIQKGTDAVFRYESAIVVYLALAYLATLPNSATEAFLLGLCVYAVYDFTNYATFEKYHFGFGVIDSLWGGILFTLVYHAKNYLKL